MDVDDNRLYLKVLNSKKNSAKTPKEVKSKRLIAQTFKQRIYKNKIDGDIQTKYK